MTNAGPVVVSIGDTVCEYESTETAVQKMRGWFVSFLKRKIVFVNYEHHTQNLQ